MKTCAGRNGTYFLPVTPVITQLTPSSPLPPSAPKATEINTEVAGYLPVPFLLLRKELFFLTSHHHQISCLFFFYMYNSTTLCCTRQGTGPIAVHRTVSIVSRIDTRRRGRAGAIGYDPPFLPSFFPPSFPCYHFSLLIFTFQFLVSRHPFFSADHI